MTNEEEAFAAAMREVKSRFQLWVPEPTRDMVADFPSYFALWKIARMSYGPEDEAAILREYAMAALDNDPEQVMSVAVEIAWDWAEAMRAEELARRKK